MSNLENFRKLGLSEETIDALERKGFEEPSPIQALTIPLLLTSDKDIVGQAQTGTGKTAAFGLPLIEKITPGNGVVQALVLAPTRELAVQVAEEMSSFKGKRKISILPVYGGQSIEGQLNRLRRGVEIVVGTPGRVIDHLNRGTLKLDQLSHVVLDEADEMLNMGFIEDIELILSKANPDRKVLLFSATMPNRILSLAQNYMNEYEIVRVETKHLTVDLTEQIYFEVHASDKLEALCRIIDIEKDFYSLVFCRTKLDVDSLSNKLNDRGYDAAALHGDISQFQRERILNQFKKRRTSILVATDVAARGIDVNDLSHVINYSIPQDPESYVHRIGRTGRAGKQGTAITFITPSEYRKLLQIQRIAKTEIRKESLPKVSDLIKLKRTRIVEEIADIVSNEKFTDNMDVANELLEQYKPDEVIASLLTHAYKDEFSPEKYPEINEPRRNRDRGYDRGRGSDRGRGYERGSRDSSPDSTGTTRLFIALGRKDEMTPKQLVDHIENKAGVASRLIKGVQIYDNFSFANVPFEEAEQIINAFRKEGRNNKPLVVKAKGEDRGGGGGGRRSHDNRDRRPGSDRNDRRSGGYRNDRGERRERSDRPRGRDKRY